MKWNQMIPEFDVISLYDTLKFYVDTIGFNVVYDRKENKFAFLQYQNVQMMVQEIDEGKYKWDTGVLEYPFGRGINFQIDVENVDKIYTNIKEAGYKIFEEIEDHWYRKENLLLGCREFLVQDPNGYLLRFSEDLGEKEVEL